MGRILGPQGNGMPGPASVEMKMATPFNDVQLLSLLAAINCRGMGVKEAVALALEQVAEVALQYRSGAGLTEVVTAKAKAAAEEQKALDQG